MLGRTFASRIQNCKIEYIKFLKWSLISITASDTALIVARSLSLSVTCLAVVLLTPCTSTRTSRLRFEMLAEFKE